MNSTFKVVFNKARGALMVVNEVTSSVQGKGTKTVIATAVTALMAGSALAASVIPEVPSDVTVTTANTAWDKVQADGQYHFKNEGAQGAFTTVTEGKNAELFDSELTELVERFETAFKHLRDIEPPKLILGEIDRTSVILRDILNPSFENIYVNDLALSKEIKRYISTIAPEKEGIVKFVSTEVPIFDHFGVDKQIKSSLGRTVSFKNGAYLIIEHTEAFHVIDVNSGNRVKLGDDQESNALEVNLAAADEVARQLQLRDMGGIIVIDFIDMQQAENRQKLFDKMRSAMELDRAKHTILPLSKFGLMQITRQRVRPEMTVTTTETCPVCHGTGKADAAVLVIDKIEDQLEFLVEEKKIKNLVLKVHPFVEAYLKKGFWSLRRKWAFKHHIHLKVIGVPSFYIYEYKFFNRFNREIEPE